MKTIPLRGKKAAGRVALVDDEDYELIMRHSWRVWEKKNDGPYAFTRIRADRRPGQSGPRQVGILMHKLITGYAKTDHIDHDGLNNQRSNLRPATTAQNAQNGRPRRSSSSRFKGVTWHRQIGKWQAAIKIDGRAKYLGCYADEAEAARAYNAAALTAWGEYAYLNEVDSA